MKIGIPKKINRQLIEPIIPLFLGIHGNLMLIQYNLTTSFQIVLVNLVLLIGILSIFYKPLNNKYMTIKFCIFSFIGLVLIFLDGGVGSYFTIWIFALAPYVLYLNFRDAIFFSIVIPLLYLFLIPFSSNPLDLIVVLQRAAVVMVIGVFVAILNRNLIEIALEKELSQKKEEEERNKLVIEQDVNKKLEKLNNELIQSNIELENFGYMISHDLRDPLSKILFSLDLVKSNNELNFNEESKVLINSIIKSGEAMNQLILDLLEYSKVSKSDKSVSLINMTEVVNAAINNLTQLINQKNAKIEFGELPTVEANKALMISLFQNLIQNGIKFNESAHPEIRIKSEIEGNFIRFSIQDNGIGIKDEDKNKIFLMFKRLDSKKEYSGTGLGLAISKKIVDKHNGTIWLESKLNEGSTFYFQFPLKTNA